MDVTDDVTATLRAEAHHPPCVLESAGFCTEHSAKSRSIGYEEETSPTLRAGVVPAAVALENHPTDSRVKIAEDGKVQTLTSRMGTGGGNVPLVMKIRSGCEGGGKGPLIQTDKSATLSCNNDQTLFEPKAYGICSKESNAMKSDNPHSGIYEAETSRTIDGNGGNPGCNQGGIAVVESYAIQGSMIGRNGKNGPQGDGINEDVSFTLNTVDRHAVYAMTTGSFTQVAEDKAPTVLARPPFAMASAGTLSTRARTPSSLLPLRRNFSPLSLPKVPVLFRVGTPSVGSLLQSVPDCRDSQTGGAMTWALPNLRWRISVIGTMCLKPIAGSWAVPQSLSL